MPTLNKTFNFPVNISPQEAAKVFCNMNDEEQAVFFNSIAEIVEKEWKNPLGFQLTDIPLRGILNKGGANVMRTIGRYASK